MGPSDVKDVPVQVKGMMTYANKAACTVIAVSPSLLAVIVGFLHGYPGPCFSVKLWSFGSDSTEDAPVWCF